MVAGRADAKSQLLQCRPTEHTAAFRQGDVGDANVVRTVCDEFRPAAALQFAAFIEVGESMETPDLFFSNNREKTKLFFKVLAEKAVRNVVFSNTAAVYGDPTAELIREDLRIQPTNFCGQAGDENRNAARAVLDRPDFTPGSAERRAGDHATLVADSKKSRNVLSWVPRRGIEDMIGSAVEWHRASRYSETI